MYIDRTMYGYHVLRLARMGVFVLHTIIKLFYFRNSMFARFIGATNLYRVKYTICPSTCKEKLHRSNKRVYL
jgi:hypothetical protein